MQRSEFFCLRKAPLKSGTLTTTPLCLKRSHGCPLMMYVVFSDEELRKKYDVYGEEGLKDDHFGEGHYQSWNYFNEEFGELAMLRPCAN